MLLATVALIALVTPVPAHAQSDTEKERDEVQERRAALEDEVDVLEATNEEIASALDELAAGVASQEAVVEAANEALAGAETAAREARAELANARRDVALLEDAISEMAIASYIHQPTTDLVESLTAESLSGAMVRKTYLDARAKRDVNLLNLLEKAEAEAEARNADVIATAEAAERAAEDAETKLTELEAKRAEQQALAAEVQERIDAALSEAAVLAERDRELSAQIQAEQAALLAKVPEPTVTGGQAGSPPPSGSGGGSGCQTPPPLATVHGITVHADIADAVDTLVTTASSAGVTLSGWGYRSCERQVELRRAHCGTSHYAIYEMPSSQCTPHTAPPGKSMHERGLAIDFENCASRSTACYQWLSDEDGDGVTNATRYGGLTNYPFEPWHWSTTGG